MQHESWQRIERRFPNDVAVHHAVAVGDPTLARNTRLVLEEVVVSAAPYTVHMLNPKRGRPCA